VCPGALQGSAWATWFEAFDRVDFEIEDLAQSGDEVVAFIRSRGRGRRSGLVIDQRIPSVWTVRGGRVLRVRGYVDDADVLDAGGPRE
jgi:ketosteroid isomerase-like protein